MAEPIVQPPVEPEPDAYFQDAQGRVVAVPQSQAQAALADGLKPASDDQAMAFEREVALRKQYDSDANPLQGLATGAESFADTLTLGGSRYLEKALGVSEEGMRARQAFNPGAENIGTAAGIILPALATGGGSLAAEGAVGGAELAAGAARAGLASAAKRAAVGALDLSAPSLITKAGAAVERGVGALLPEAEGLGARMVREGVTKAAGSAVEGAFYSTGHVLSENAIGSPNATAESIATEIGLGALLGGGLGAGFSVGGGALSHLAGKAADKLEESGAGKRLAEWLGGVEGTRNLKAAGAIQTDLRRMEDQVGKAEMEKIGREAGELGLVTPFSTPAKVAERSSDLLEKTGKQIGNFLTDADARLAADELPSAASVMARARERALAPLEKNPLEREAAARVAADLDAMAEKYGAAEGQPITLKEMHEVRRWADNRIFGLKGNKDPYASEYSKGLKRLRDTLSDEIESGVERSGVDSAEWKSLNRTYQVASQVKKAAIKGMQRAEGNNLISPTELMSGAAMAGGSIANGNDDILDVGKNGLGALLLVAGARRYGSGALGAAARMIRERLASKAAALEAATVAAERNFAEERAVRLAAKADALATQQADEAAAHIEAVAKKARAARQAADLADAEALNARLEADRLAAGPTDPTAMGLAMQRAGLAPAQHIDDIKAAVVAHDLGEIARAAEAEWQDALGKFAPKVEEVAEAPAMATVTKLPVRVPEKVKALAEIERASQRVSNRIASGITAILNESSRVATVGRGEVAAGVARQFGKPDEDALKTFKRRVEEIQKLADDPDRMQETLARVVDDLEEHAPETAQALRITEARKIAFLASKIPPTTKRGPFARAIAPNPAAVAKFHRYYEAVKDPLSVLKQAGAGTITPEAVEAVATVYPDKYAEMKSTLIEKVAAHRGTLPYRARVMLSLLTGTSVDGTTLLESVRANQATFKGPSAADTGSQPRPSRPTRTGMKAGSLLSSRLLTPSQEARQRR